jgi:hypothetical protein
VHPPSHAVGNGVSFLGVKWLQHVAKFFAFYLPDINLIKSQLYCEQISVFYDLFKRKFTIIFTRFFINFGKVVIIFTDSVIELTHFISCFRKW